MSQLQLIFSILFFFINCINVNAQTTSITTQTATTTTPPVIITPAPTAKEIIATPEGYVNCFTVEAGWMKNMWVPAHRICQYENVPGQTVTYEGVAWIDSYWACTAYTESNCTNWEWKPGRWVKTLEVY